MLDLNDVADVVADAVREATAPLLKRIADLETRELVLPSKGETGEKGEPGAPGKDADMDLVKQWVSEGIAAAVEALPTPEKGEPGERGPEGPEGKKGADGAPGADGKDGSGIADAFIDKGGNLVITMSDGRTKSLGQVNGNDGKDGVDGESFTIDDFTIEPISERSFVFRLTKGDFAYSTEIEFPVAIYRGVWGEGSYAKGDMVTWAGSLWHANEDTSDKPGSGVWQLAAKKGRDGRDAK